MAAASYIVRDGADAMAVSLACLADTPAGAMRNRSPRNRTPIAKIFTPIRVHPSLSNRDERGGGQRTESAGGKSATARARYRSLGKARDATEALCSVRFRGTSPIF